MDLTKLQLTVSKAVECPCARVCDIQTLINLVRLERHRGDLPGLEKALEQLDVALERLWLIDLSVLPREPAEAVRDGRLFRDGQAARPLEIAKFRLAEVNFDDALVHAAPLAPQSNTALEIQVRCELELRRYDKMLEKCAALMAGRDWLRDYAAIALLRGGQVAAARELAARLTNHHPIPRLRLILELLSYGCAAEAVALGKRVSMEARTRSEEPTMLIAAALFHSARIELGSLAEDASRIASVTRHFPFAELAAPAVGFGPSPGRLSSARSDLAATALQFHRAMRGHAPGAPSHAPGTSAEIVRQQAST